MSGLVVAETQDAVLVAPCDQVQDAKKIVGRLQRDKRPECRQHSLVYRPWGSYETLVMDGRLLYVWERHYVWMSAIFFVSKKQSCVPYYSQFFRV